MVRFEDVTEEEISKKNKLNELKGLVKKVLGEDIKLIHIECGLYILTKDGNDIGAIYPYRHEMVLKNHGFEEQVKEIGIGYEKIYDLDGKKKQFVIEKDYS
ncbi:hypothetical protein ES703_116914 [subsurface metagenome]